MVSAPAANALPQQPTLSAAVARQEPVKTDKKSAADKLALLPAAAINPAARPKPSKATDVTLAGKSAKDGDVELIAALLNRISPQQPALSKDIARKTGAEGAVSPLKKDRIIVGKRGVTERSVQVVDSTEALLNRCKSMGFFEGELCRFRVCSNRWESDPACSDPPRAAVLMP